MIHWLAIIVGYLVIGALAISVISVSIWLIFVTFKRALQVRYDDAKLAALQQVASRLIHDSHWFSEHLPTSFLLQEIANDLTTHGWSDVSEVRNRWRERMTIETFRGGSK
jgi:hypothetical protein